MNKGVSGGHDKGLILETSALERFYGGQFTLSVQMIKPIMQDWKWHRTEVTIEKKGDVSMSLIKITPCTSPLRPFRRSKHNYFAHSRQFGDSKVT